MGVVTYYAMAGSLMGINEPDDVSPEAVPASREEPRTMATFGKSAQMAGGANEQSATASDIGAISLPSEPPVSGSAIAAQQDNVRAVKVMPVAERALSQTMRFSGIVRAEKRAQLSFTVGGRLEGRVVNIGDRVRQGQEMAHLDIQPFRNAVLAARAQLRDAGARLAQMKRDNARVRRLLKSNAAGREEAEKVRAGRNSALAAADAARVQLAEARRLVEESRLLAPFAGTVSAVMMEPGEFVRPGMPVVVLSGEDRLEVEIEVPESARARLRAGAEVSVSLPLVGKGSFSGVIDSIGRATVGRGRLFPVIVAIDPDTGPNPGTATDPAADSVIGNHASVPIVPGLTAEVTIDTGVVNTTAVPIAAVVDPGGQRPYVYRVAAGRAEQVLVDVDVLLNDAVSVRGELVPGDLIVVEGHSSLITGERVEVVQ